MSPPQLLGLKRSCASCWHHFGWLETFSVEFTKISQSPAVSIGIDGVSCCQSRSCLNRTLSSHGILILISRLDERNTLPVFWVSIQTNMLVAFCQFYIGVECIYSNFRIAQYLEIVMLFNTSCESFLHAGENGWLFYTFDWRHPLCDFFQIRLDMSVTWTFLVTFWIIFWVMCTVEFWTTFKRESGFSLTTLVHISAGIKQYMWLRAQCFFLCFFCFHTVHTGSGVIMILTINRPHWCWFANIL